MWSFSSAFSLPAIGLVLTLPFATLQAQQPGVTNNIAYYDDDAPQTDDAYRQSQCRLDLRYPVSKAGFATVVWFHGGGLTSGRRHFIDLKDPSIAVAAVGYRLSPQVEHPGYLEDAAAATAWVLRNIGRFGGDTNKVFVSGHSAGGYLSAMIGMDPRWLARHGFSHRQLAGIVPISGQVTTHFHVKKLRGDTQSQYRPIIDEFAPLYYSSAELSPICLIVGDRRIEYKNRVEENDLLATSLRNLGHQHVEFYEMGGLNHSTVGQGAMILLREFVGKLSRPSDAAKTK
jgi:acetyl esterase/lipase